MVGTSLSEVRAFEISCIQREAKNFQTLTGHFITGEEAI